ncbi:MAG: glycosyltransferase family 4 protein, partial [Hydrococcus sp. SU_1_0]|nr:glycosyltransferase family 4 protein [Hydrococcus sp. SU_1_0]
MKITFCTYDAVGFTGGPNSWLRRVLPDFKKAGIECKVLFFIDHNSPDNCPCWRDLQTKGFSCNALLRGKPLFAQIRWLLSEVAKEPPDIFVTNLSPVGLYAGRWLKEAGIPTVGILHSDDEYYRSILQKFVFGNTSEQLSTLVCVSDFLTEYAHSFGGTKTAIKCIPYGVPIPERVAAPPQETMQLIYVGRLVDEQKQISQV